MTASLHSQEAASFATAGARDLAGMLEPIRKKHGLPALTGAVLTGDRLIALGATGVRSTGLSTKVSVSDRWHIGSCTKAMTATLASLLVREGAIDWDTTVADRFRELRLLLHRAYLPVTLKQFLNHRSGLPPDLSPGDDVFPRYWELVGPMKRQRHQLVGMALSRKPMSKPGEAMHYSNSGYAVAAAMLERATGKSWEELITERLLTPLGMASAGFGAPGTKGANDEPRGHRDGAPVEPAREADNPAVIRPAGGLHCSMPDWARFVALHLRAAKGTSRLLSRKQATRLHTPSEGARYTHGWGAVDRPWGGGAVLTHSGSNTLWYCVVWMAPKKDFAVLVATNTAGKSAPLACDEAAGALIRLGSSLER